MQLQSLKLLLNGTGRAHDAVTFKIQFTNNQILASQLLLNKCLLSDGAFVQGKAKDDVIVSPARPSCKVALPRDL